VGGNQIMISLDNVLQNIINMALASGKGGIWLPTLQGRMSAR